VEGGFFDWKSPRSGEHAKPRVVLLSWRRGKG
jgi:hypothetical protein